MSQSVSLPMRSFVLRIADRVDQIALLALYARLCWRFLENGLPPHYWHAVMLLISEGVVMFFVLTRRSTDRISLNPTDWIIAFSGTLLPMLVSIKGAAHWTGVGFALILLGFCIHFGAKLSLARSFGIVPADRGIKTNGLYALVRHPMYFGYMIAHVGFLVSTPTLWNLGIYVSAWCFLIWRIVREERLLCENPAYEAYTHKVRYRMIPGVF